MDKVLEQRFTAIDQLSEITKEIALDENVKLELYGRFLQPRSVDRYLSLSVLLNQGLDDADRVRPVEQTGAFRQAFLDVFNPEEMPELAYYVAKGNQLNNRSLVGAIPDTSDLYLYCPYCEEYTVEQIGGGFSVIPNTYLDNVEEGIGYEPQSDGTYLEKTMDDDYGFGNPTLIATGEPDGGHELGPVSEIFEICDEFECCIYVTNMIEGVLVTELIECYEIPPSTGGNGGNSGGSSGNWEDCTGFDQLWTGKIQVTKQWDSWLGFTNTGGSEMVLGRIGPENMTLSSSGHIDATGFSAVVRKYMSRKRIRNRSVESWDLEFDPNWDCEEAPQRFIYYEEDNTSTTKLGAKFTLKTKIKLGIIEAEAGTEVGFGVDIKSDDDVIWAQTYEREEFFPLNTTNGGCGTDSGWRKHACYDGWITIPSKFVN